MKPGAANKIVTALRVDSQLHFAENLLAVALAYCVKLTPDGEVEPTGFYLVNHASNFKDIIGCVNEEQMIETELTEKVAKETFEWRCRSTFNPRMYSKVQEITAGWDPTTWKVYDEICEVICGELGS